MISLEEHIEDFWASAPPFGSPDAWNPKDGMKVAPPPSSASTTSEKADEGISRLRMPRESNVVTSVKLSMGVDLFIAAMWMYFGRYCPRGFSCNIYSCDSMSWLLAHTGAITITKCSTINGTLYGAHMVTRMISGLPMPIFPPSLDPCRRGAADTMLLDARTPKPGCDFLGKCIRFRGYRVSNIVASMGASGNGGIDIHSFYRDHAMHCRFVPNSFPGCSYYMADPGDTSSTAAKGVAGDSSGGGGSGPTIHRKRGRKSRSQREAQGGDGGGGGQEDRSTKKYRVTFFDSGKITFMGVKNRAVLGRLARRALEIAQKYRDDDVPIESTKRRIYRQKRTRSADIGGGGGSSRFSVLPMERILASGSVIQPGTSASSAVDVLRSLGMGQGLPNNDAGGNSVLSQGTESRSTEHGHLGPAPSSSSCSAVTMPSQNDALARMATSVLQRMNMNRTPGKEEPTGTSAKDTAHTGSQPGPRAAAFQDSAADQWAMDMPILDLETMDDIINEASILSARGSQRGKASLATMSSVRNAKAKAGRPASGRPQKKRKSK